MERQAWTAMDSQNPPQGGRCCGAFGALQSQFIKYSDTDCPLPSWIWHSVDLMAAHSQSVSSQRMLRSRRLRRLESRAGADFNSPPQAGPLDAMHGPVLLTMSSSLLEPFRTYQPVQGTATIRASRRFIRGLTMQQCARIECHENRRYDWTRRYEVHHPLGR